MLAQSNRILDPKLWVVLGAKVVGDKFFNLLRLRWFRVKNIYLTIVKDLHYNVGAGVQSFVLVKDLHWRSTTSMVCSFIELIAVVC